jgi:phage terminase Nu1 subunit (DNA packaging protein)
MVDVTDVEAEWSGVLRTIRAGLVAVPSRMAQRLTHLIGRVGLNYKFN